jgi:hypothetical protein
MEKNFKLLKTPEEAYNLLLEITSIDIYKRILLLYTKNQIQNDL